MVPCLSTHKKISSMKNKKQILGIVLFLGLCLSIGGCKSLETDRTFNKPGMTVSFLRLYELDEDLEDFQIDHPVEVTTEQVRNHLLSIFYQDISRPDQRPIPVFTIADVKKLATGLKAALNRVEDGDYIYFGFQAEKGVTEGEIFSSVGKIHWRFLRVNGVDYSNHFLGTTKPTWRLVRRTSGQSIYKEKTGLIKVTKENWIIVDIKMPKFTRKQKLRSRKPASTKRTPSKKQTEILNVPTHQSGQIKEKLKSLKELYDNGLIDEQDYQKKKNEILNQNF